MRNTLLACALCALAGAGQAQSVDLLQACRAAQANDPAWAAARQALAAAQTQRDQARALWKPSLQLSAFAGRATAENATHGAQFSAPGFGQSSPVDFTSSVERGRATRWHLMLQQPVWSRARAADSAKLRLQADAAEAAWAAAQSDLMLRCAQQYFELALAQDRLRIVQSQLQSVQRAADEAHERFRIGDAPVTDTHEADAALALLQAQQASAELDLQHRQRIVSDSTGLPQPLALLPLRLPAQQQPPNALPQWLEAVQAHNVRLRQQQYATDMAQQELRKHGALSAPSLDIVAQASRDRLSGQGDFSGAARNQANAYMVGVQVSIPLYSGGMRSAQTRQARHLLDKAQADLQQTRQDVLQQARMLWGAQAADRARVQALAAARKASNARREATLMGRKLGERSTLDVLNAESARASSDLAWAQALVGATLNALRMAAMTQTLDEAALQAANAALN